MEKDAFSQMPVFSGGKKVGTTTDGNVTTLLPAA
jgi:predicted transcriptional regulator